MSIQNIFDFIASVLIFSKLPEFLAFAFGKSDPFIIALPKQLFLLLPVLAILMAYWITMVCLISVVVRADRAGFLHSLFVAWWDLGRAIFSFWGGVFKFCFELCVAFVGVIKLCVGSLWAFMAEVFVIPFRTARNMGETALSPGTPWIAVLLTCFWCVLEATIFTFVCSPLVVDTLSNMTGGQLTAATVKAPLFIFMLFIVLGSYAVLANWTTALKSRDIAAMVKIGVIEGVVLSVEVMFLYREFVDALVPWFAQHTSREFELGVTGTLTIAGLTWFGIRGISWFLFANQGTPTILAIIGRSGVITAGGPSKGVVGEPMEHFRKSMAEIKKQMEWMHDTGEEILSAFILPPLQVVAATINFCTLMVHRHPLFELPFKHINDLKINRTVDTSASPTVARKRAA